MRNSHFMRDNPIIRTSAQTTAVHPRQGDSFLAGPFVTRRDYCPRLLSLRLTLRRRCRKFFRASKRTRQHERERERKLAGRVRKKGAHAKKKEARATLKCQL